MISGNNTLFSSLIVLLIFGVILTFSSAALAEKEVSYEDFEPFLTELENGIDSAESPSVTVETHNESLDIDTDDPESLVEFVDERTGATREGNGRIVDRKIRMIGEKAFSVCLGTVHEDDSTVGETIFCQGLENNLLTKLTVKDPDGNVIGDYRTNG